MVMFILSLVFYKERSIFPDTSFYIFNIVRQNSFHIEMFRFGDVLTQFLPVIARNLNLPLRTVIICYSAGMAVYFFACYFICGLLKQFHFALLIFFINFLFISDSFFWIVSQLPQAIALLVVILSFIRAKRPLSALSFNFFVLLLLLSILVFYHPLIILLILYSVIYFFKKGLVFKNRKQVFLFSSIILAVLIIKVLFFRTEYERHSLSGLKNFVVLFPNYFNTYSDKQFLLSCLSKYCWIPITSIVR
jgi:hypothetical protein